LSVHITK
jgi:hypothetical protein